MKEVNVYHIFYGGGTIVEDKGNENVVDFAGGRGIIKKSEFVSYDEYKAYESIIAKKFFNRETI